MFTKSNFNATSSNAPTTDNGGRSNLSGAAIAGIAVASVAVAVLLCFLAFWFKYRKRNRNSNPIEPSMKLGDIQGTQRKPAPPGGTPPGPPPAYSGGSSKSTNAPRGELDVIQDIVQRGGLQEEVDERDILAPSGEPAGLQMTPNETPTHDSEQWTSLCPPSEVPDSGLTVEQGPWYSSFSGFLSANHTANSNSEVERN